MKKKFLCILLAMLLCLSVVLVSCDDNEPDTPAQEEAENEQQGEKEEKKIDVSQCKATVVKYLKENGRLLSEEMLDPETFVSEIEQTKYGAELAVKSEDETVEVKWAMKDGLMYMMADGEETYILLQNMEVKTFAKDENGEWILVPEEPEDPSEEDTSEDTAAILMMLMGVNFDRVTKDDIYYENEKFLVSNGFLAEMLVRSTIDSVLGDAELTDEQKAEMEAEIAEGKAEFKKMFDVMGFELAFRADETEVKQMILSIDMDEEAMREMGSLAENSEGHMKLEISVTFSDSAKSVQTMSLKMDCYEEDRLDVFMDLEMKVESETKVTLKGEVSSEDHSLGEKVEGTLSGKIVMNDAFCFPTQIPAIVQSYMK